MESFNPKNQGSDKKTNEIKTINENQRFRQTSTVKKGPRSPPEPLTHSSNQSLKQSLLISMVVMVVRMTISVTYYTT